MKTHSRTALFAAIAALSLAAPMAFAQDAATPADPAPAAQEQKMGWADVDTNQDGNVSKDESAAVPSLAQVFDQADADADGQLTPQEYQAFVAQQQSGAAAPTGEAEEASDGE